MRELIAQAEALSSVIDSVENCPILYSDTIRSRQVNRDDLWAITTEQLLYLRQLVRLFRAQATQAGAGEPVAWLAFEDHDTINAISPARRKKWIEADPLQQFAAKAYPVAVYSHPDPRIAELEALLKEWLDGEYDGQDYLRRVRLVLHKGAPVAALGGK